MVIGTKYIGRKGGTMETGINPFSDYVYSLLEVGPYRINQVDDDMIDKRHTQETFIIISEVCSEVIVYGEKKISKVEETTKPL
jgi:hypothetical protein